MKINLNCWLFGITFSRPVVPISDECTDVNVDVSDTFDKHVVIEMSPVWNSYRCISTHYMTRYHGPGRG